jgi:hypothetical protein
MGATDSKTSVSHGNDHLQVWSGHLDPGGISERPAMKAMKRMGVKKCVEKTGTTYIGNNNNFFPGKSHTRKGLIQRMKNLLMRTSGAEHGWTAAV